MDKMEATVPQALREKLERKGRKEFRGQQVQTEMTAHRGHRETLGRRVQPEPLGHKAHRAMLLCTRTSLLNNCQT